MAVIEDSSITPISPKRTVHPDLGISISPILPTSDLTRHLSPPSPDRLPPNKLAPISPRSPRDRLKRKVSKIRFKRKSSLVTESPVPTQDAFPLPIDEDEIPSLAPSVERLLISDHLPAHTPDATSIDDINQGDNHTSVPVAPNANLDLAEYAGKVLAIKLLGTDPLKPHIHLSHPLVKISLFSDKTCRHVKKSEKSRAVSSFYETDNENVDYILPQLTGPAAVNTCNRFTPQWKEELLFNEDLSYLLSDPSLLLLFELLEFKESSLPNLTAKKGWKHIAWAFLKLTGANTCVHLEKKLRLQLYCYLSGSGRERCENRAFYSWYHGCRKKYPSTLHLIPRAMRMQVAPAALRSQAPNQPEIAAIRSITSQHSDQTIPSLGKQHTRWNRLSGQKCEVPDSALLLCPLPRMGGSVVKFSVDGTLLAVALVQGEEAQIAVYSVPDCEEVARFKGHHGLIYDLSWSSTCPLLASASQDSTTRVWSLSHSSHSPHSCYKLLPHPSYVYCVCFHPSSQTILFTAGYDREIRVWGIGALGVNSSQILREFRSHEGYINCLTLDSSGARMFSGDSEGCVCVWQVALSGASSEGELERWRELDRMELREIKGGVIKSLSVSGRRLLVHTCDGAVRLVDMRKQAVLKRYPPPSPHSATHTLSRSSLTPCHSHVYLGAGSELCVWEVESATRIPFSLEQLSLPLADVTCVDYHPYDHILALCTYGQTGSLLVSRYTPPLTPSQTHLAEMTSLATERPVSTTSLADTAMLSLRERVRQRLHSSPESEKEGDRGSLNSTWDSLGSLTIPPPGRGLASPLMMEYNAIAEEELGETVRTEVTESYESQSKSLLSELTLGMLDTPARAHTSTPFYSASEVEEGGTTEVRGRRSAARRRRTLSKQNSVNSPLHSHSVAND